jgi:hypothetical protein
MKHRRTIVGIRPERDDENVESRKGNEFFQQLMDYQILKQVFVYGVSFLVRTLGPDVSCLLHCKEKKNVD